MNDTVPGSWQLTPAEVEALAATALGPPENPDNTWRPEGGSILGGIGQCLYDEIAGIIDLTKLLWEMNRDIDIAADGVDNYEFIGRSASADMITVLSLYRDLDNGTRFFNDLPIAQREALFRNYAMRELVKKTLREIGKGGMNLLAAYDMHWSQYDIWTLNQGENLLKALAQAVSYFFTDAEWQAMAAGGVELSNRVRQLVTQRIQQDPWGTSGYAACLVALILSPTKIARALRALSTTLRTAAATGRMSDLAAVLRASGVAVPPWMGGRAVTPDVPNPVNPPIGPNLPIEPSNPTRADPPPARPTPEPDANTTVVQGSRTARIGQLAEADARARLEAQGYNTFELKNGSGHGPDIIAVKPGNPPEIRVIEVKANGSSLNPLQQQGGAAYIDNVLRRARSPNASTWNIQEYDRFMRRNGLTDADLAGSNFEIWRYQNVDPDVPSSVADGPKTTPWTAGTTGREFSLDANGNIVTRNGPTRPWTQWQEPLE